MIASVTERHPRGCLAEVPKTPFLLLLFFLSSNMLISDEDDIDVAMSCVDIGVVDTEFSMFVVGAMTALKF